MVQIYMKNIGTVYVHFRTRRIKQEEAMIKVRLEQRAAKQSELKQKRIEAAKREVQKAVVRCFTITY